MIVFDVDDDDFAEYEPKPGRFTPPSRSGPIPWGDYPPEWDEPEPSEDEDEEED